MTTKQQRCMGLLWVAAGVMMSPSLADGSDRDAASNLYSQGVHAYFAGRASEAESLLSRALELDDEDPRFLYFRALSRLGLGRAVEARSDMAAGAAREAARSNRYAVGNALQRVQGSQRLLLEQYRREAHSKAATVDAEVARQRAEQLSARDAGAFRERVIIPLDELLRPGGPRALSAEEVARRGAIAQQSRVTPPQPDASSTPAPETAADEDPFRDDAPPSVHAPLPPQAESNPPSEAVPSDEDADDNPFGDF